MAVTSIWDVRGRLNKLIAYAINSEKTENTNYEIAASLHVIDSVVEYAADDMKTEQKLFVTGINVDEEIASTQFIQTKKKWNKTGGIVAYHGIQSFASGEVDAQTAHKIGVELAQKLWGERFEVIVATHCNTDHYHNHFVLNSVSFMDGKRYYDNKESYNRMRAESDRLCDKYGLSVIYDPKNNKLPYPAWRDKQDGKLTKFDTYRRDIDAAISGSVTLTSFLRAMSSLGYEVITQGKYPRFKELGSTKFHRFYKLGENYTLDSIIGRILYNIEEKNPYDNPGDVDMREAPVYTHENKTNLYTMFTNYKIEINFYRKYPYAQRYIHPLIREDLAKLDKIDKQTRFLGRTKIKTMDELVSYKEKALQDIESLLSMRDEQRAKLKRDKRTGNEVEVEKTKTEIAVLSASIKEKRKEVNLCDSIAERSKEIPECLSFMDEQRNKGKEKKTDEHIRRSGRTNRENEPQWG